MTRRPHRCDPRSDFQCPECHQRQLAEEREAEAGMMGRFVIRETGEVLDAGLAVMPPALGHIERVGEWHIAIGNCGYPLAGPTKMRELAALTIIREHYPDATLLDILVP